MPNVSDVILMDVSKIIPERAKKYCVCVSAGNGKYLYINSNHREMYDDFEIKAADYDFLEHDSYIGCSEAHVLGEDIIVRKLGNINHEDMKKILGKLRSSRRIVEVERDEMVLELEEWMNDYQRNKLSDAFKER